MENCGFFESIPLWAVMLIGDLFTTVLSFAMIMTVYGCFFKLYPYTIIAPVPLSTFAGEPNQNVGKNFIKSYAVACLEGAIIVLACIIFSLFVASPPVVDSNTAAVTQVWSHVGELPFNMLILVGAVKMAGRVVREMMDLQELKPRRFQRGTRDQFNLRAKIKVNQIEKTSKSDFFRSIQSLLVIYYLRRWFQC